ncbi:MAG TPA: DNA methyltransferase [Chloroflexia bacterium]|nr:DNA methyltransferase [Chloroflexia bacterium]
MALTLPDFIARWQASTRTEKSAAQEHFLDLCAVLGQPTPAQADATGAWYTFEKGVAKTGGGQGFADVWMRGRFAWEYKGPGKDLAAAYQQLLQYREDLENPPLLVVCDLQRFEVHTNFTGTAKRVYRFTLADLAHPTPTPTSALPPLDVLRALFTDPARLRPAQTTADVTEAAAREFAELAASLRAAGAAPQAAAHFLMRLLFCLFAEDIGLLPPRLFGELVETNRTRPLRFKIRLEALFAAMATGGDYGNAEIRHFDGGLFDDNTVLDLGEPDLSILARAAALDWASVEPAIFGTLFERSLDPTKRSQLGAHYTSREDILLVIEPVLMAPLRRRWAAVQTAAEALVGGRGAASGGAARTRQQVLARLLMDCAAEIAAVRVLDPACGSGNFLYVALKQLLDLEKEVVTYAATHQVGAFFPQVHPQQLYGIEINPYAHELASVVVWIGYIQWLHDNGFGVPPAPILRALPNIARQDAILAHDAEGRPVEPAWPAADVIIGNPPFLGDKKMRRELGDQYVDTLRTLYRDRVPGGADLVTYWFERARAQIASGQAQRAGLLATNSITGGANRTVLERIKQSGDIFLGWRDRPWILDGAAVRVALVGFDNSSETARSLDGVAVTTISADLYGDIDLTQAQRLKENGGIAFIGDMKKGKFDISGPLAQQMLQAPLNPNGRPNRDVVRPWINGLDITRRPQGMWIIDFGIAMPEAEAALYEIPYEYVRQHVKPERDQVRNPLERAHWWLHGRPAPDLRAALQELTRYIATPRLAKHRLFVYMDAAILPDGQVVIIARDSDYWLGMLHSRIHEMWTLRMCTWLGVGNDPRYTPTTTFETFPFPWPPGQEPAGDPRVEAIAAAARDLVAKRDAWLNPPGAPAADLALRTLTHLYNQRPTWLAQAHQRLDAAVLAAYGWPATLADAAILAQLLALNQARAGGG